MTEPLLLIGAVLVVTGIAWILRISLERILG